MRGTRIKLNRRKAKATPSELHALSFSNRQLYTSYDIVQNKGDGSPRDLVSAVKPYGTWKEFWHQKIRNISYQNRLPRGFKQPTHWVSPDLHWDFP